MAGWTVVGASVIVVLSAFQAMSALNSVEMRDQLTRLVTTGSAKNLGITVDQALDAVRVGLYVAGLAAVVTGVLGVYVLQRNHLARIILTVAAVPVVLTSPIAGSLPGMIVGAGAAMLWTRQARDWFAGRPITPVRTGPFAVRESADRAGDRAGDRATDLHPAPRTPVFEPPAVDPNPDPAALPPPTPAWGAPAGQSVDFPAPIGAPVWPAPAAPGGAAVAGRPQQVRIASLLTWIFGAFTGLGGLAMALVAVLARDELVDRVVADSRWDPTLDRDLIVPVVVTLGILVTLWCIANAVLAVFVWQGHRWAWITLDVSIGLAAVFSVLAFPMSLVHMAALAASLGMLTSAPTRSWFAVSDPRRDVPRPR